MKNGLLIISFAISLSNAADIQKAIDFDPIEYFKHDLNIPADTQKAKKTDIEKYCLRLQEFATILFCQAQLAEMLCTILPAIGPSEAYEKYRFVDGWCIDGWRLGSENEQGIVDAEHSSRPGQIGLRIINSAPAISLVLSLSKILPDNIEAIFPLIKNILEKSHDEELLFVAGLNMHSLLVNRFIAPLNSAPIIFNLWNIEAFQFLKKTGSFDRFDTLDRVVRTSFSEVAEVFDKIPLWQEIIHLYRDLCLAYVRSGPLESTLGVKITPEFKEVKEKISQFLVRLKLDINKLNALYMKVVQTLLKVRAPLRSDHKKYVSFAEEFIPADILGKYAKKRALPLPLRLDYTCLEKYNQGKNVVKVEAVAAAATTPIAQGKISPQQPQQPQKTPKSDINKTVDRQISYDARIMDWLNPSFTHNKLPLSILYHTFSFLADPIIKKYGKNATFIARDRKHHQTYHLAGEIEYLSGPKKGKKELYVFVNTYDQNGILYHRGIEKVNQMDNFFQDFFSKSYAQIQEQEQTGKSLPAPSNGHDKIISENEYSIVIHDARNNINITLLKPLEGLSYN